MWEFSSILYVHMHLVSVLDKGLLYWEINKYISIQPTNSLCAAESFLRSSQSLGYSRNSQHFMEPEGPLPCSKSPLLDAVLSQMNPIYTTPFYFT
jgi:hypothetical protein